MIKYPTTFSDHRRAIGAVFHPQLFQAGIGDNVAIEGGDLAPGLEVGGSHEGRTYSATCPLHGQDFRRCDPADFVGHEAPKRTDALRSMACQGLTALSALQAGAHRLPRAAHDLRATLGYDTYGRSSMELSEPSRTA